MKISKILVKCDTIQKEEKSDSKMTTADPSRPGLVDNAAVKVQLPILEYSGGQGYLTININLCNVSCQVVILPPGWDLHPPSPGHKS